MLHAREGVAVLEDQVGLGEGAGAAPALEVELMADIAARDGLERREIGEVAGQGLPVWTSGAPDASASSIVVTAVSGS